MDENKANYGNPYCKSVEAEGYCQLTDEQALRLALRHNVNGYLIHRMTFRDIVSHYLHNTQLHAHILIFTCGKSTACGIWCPSRRTERGREGGRPPSLPPSVGDWYHFSLGLVVSVVQASTPHCFVLSPPTEKLEWPVNWSLPPSFPPFLPWWE